MILWINLDNKNPNKSWSRLQDPGPSYRLIPTKLQDIELLSSEVYTRDLKGAEII